MSNCTSLIEFLVDYHEQVMSCEKKALEALNGGDSTGYKALMRQKAELMSRILDEASPYLASSPAGISALAEHSLKRFAASAKLGLKLESPFYWSALLWNDDAKPGDPDNLKIFIDELSAEMSGKE